MMVTEETAQRIAAALERLERVMERLEHPAIAMAAVPDEVKRADVVYCTRILPTTEVQSITCYRCFPSHPLDWHNPCKSHRSMVPREDGQ